MFFPAPTTAAPMLAVDVERGTLRLRLCTQKKKKFVGSARAAEECSTPQPVQTHYSCLLVLRVTLRGTQECLWRTAARPSAAPLSSQGHLFLWFYYIYMQCTFYKRLFISTL